MSRLSCAVCIAITAGKCRTAGHSSEPRDGSACSASASLGIVRNLQCQVLPRIDCWWINRFD